MIAFLTLLTVVVQVTSSGSQCGMLSHQLHNAQNKVLKNYVYKRATVPNHVICGRDCSMDKKCKSFDFNHCEKLCQLSNATRSEHTEDFLDDQGSVYFDADEDTPHHSRPDSAFIRYKNCKEILEAGYLKSSVYNIFLNGSICSLPVYCDMDTAGGGWIVVQRRYDGSVDFHRNWTEYKAGFGDLSGEFWLGNDNLQALTDDETHGPWVLRIDLGRPEGDKVHVTYRGFKILGEQYILNSGEYQNENSTAGNSLSSSNGMPFSTWDRDNDESPEMNYAEETGAWWYKETPYSRINGPYYPEPGIGWSGWTTGRLDKSNMKIR